MNTVLIALGVIGGTGGLLGLIIYAYARSQKKAGMLEERAREQQQASEAKKRADDVLAEHRDPDDGHVAERLRRGDF